MHRYQKYTCFLFILILGLFSNLSAQSFRHLGIEDGLSQPSVMRIEQDGLGRMWFGTNEGVNIYDGTRVTTYKGYVSTADKGSLWLGNAVEHLKADKKGNMYIICNGNLFFYNLETDVFSQLTGDGLTTAIEIVGDSVIYAKNDSIYVVLGGIDKPKAFMKLPADLVNFLLADEGKLYIGTDKGLFVSDLNNLSAYTSVLSNEDIYNIVKISTEELWISSRMNGLYIYRNGNIHKVPVDKNGNGTIDRQVRQIVEDNNHTVWIGTFLGLQKYDISTGKFSTMDIPRYAGGLNHLSIFSLFKDRQGTIWVGSYYGGVNYFNPNKNSYFNYDYQASVGYDNYFSYIRSIVKDKHGRLWIGTDGGGISCINKQWQRVKHFTVDDKNSISHNNIKSLCYDEENDKLYVGMYLGGFNCIDVKTGAVKKYYSKDGGNKLYPSDVVYNLRKWKNYIILSSRKGIFKFDVSTDEFTSLPAMPDYCEFFDVDEKGMFYGYSSQYLITYSLLNPKHVEKIDLREHGVKAAVSSLLANKGNVYLTTLGGGLLCWNTREHKLFSQTTENSNIFSDYCYNIQFINSDKAILISDNGVMLYDETTGLYVNLELNNDRMFQFINGCGLYISGEDVYAGNTRGITCLQESDFYNEDIKKGALYFSSIQINNKLLKVNDETGILKRSVPFTERIDLEHNQNHVIISLATSDYLHSRIDIEYDYQLSGVDDEWVRTHNPQIQYANLNPGTYTLRIKEVGQTEVERTLVIHVASPWYDTWWAWLGYLSVLVIITVWQIRTRRNKQAMKLALEREIFVKEKNDESNREKLVFFTNISHEFRTPITLIANYTDKLINDTKDYPSIHRTIVKLRRNTLKLNSLVTELLDFRRFTQDQFMLRMGKADICLFIRNIYSSFADYAKTYQISYKFTANFDEITCWFDAVQLEKAFYNILSNAFKFTNEHGRIDVAVKQLDKNVVVTISDSGVGISKEDLKRIFDRFYQSDNGLIMKGSTGIGLALTKTIVEKHHGEIEVFSEKDKGSTFVVTLPYDRNVYENDPHISFVDENDVSSMIDSQETQKLGMINKDEMLEYASEASESAVDETSGVADSSILDADSETYTVLLVEDNEELLIVLKDLFEKYYNVETATNGKEALDLVHAKMPDLIVSDIMMPVMSGTELCMAIKNNIDYCHIPVVLLTALDGVPQSMEGFSRGADDYISKPFNADLLIVRVKNLLRNRKLIHYQFTKKPIEEIDLTCVREMDQDLLRKASSLIEERMDDIDVTLLCQELGISRSLLYVKFKSLTGMTPNNYIISMKLKHAATLLIQNKDISITEVCDRCGFNSPAYFSKCFKAQYSVAPMDYRKKHNDASADKQD